jgi:4-hydroxybenzoate polyprenyltransferase
MNIGTNVYDYLRMLRIGDWIKFYIAVPLAGALLAGAISIAIISIRMSLVGFGLVLLNILLFIAYSGGIRLKERAILDILTHGLMFGAVPFLAGFALCQGSISSEILGFAMLLFILGGEALIAHQIMEYEEDVKSTRTTVTMIGQGNGLLILGISTLVSISVLFFATSTKQMPFWAMTIIGLYLLAYPIYSCRSLFRDIRRIARPE